MPDAGYGVVVLIEPQRELIASRTTSAFRDRPHPERLDPPPPATYEEPQPERQAHRRWRAVLQLAGVLFAAWRSADGAGAHPYRLDPVAVGKPGAAAREDVGVPLYLWSVFLSESEGRLIWAAPSRSRRTSGSPWW